MNTQEGPVRHVFAWQVVRPEDNARVVEMLTTFSNAVDEVLYYEIGTHVGDPNENGEPWDGVLITDFATWADLATYSDHPDHVDLVAELLPLVKSRAVVDFVRRNP